MMWRDLAHWSMYIFLISTTYILIIILTATILGKYTNCLNYANKKVKNHMLALGKPSCNKVNVYKYIQYVFLFRCFRNIPPYFLRKIIIIIIDIITVIVLIMLLMLTRPITAKIITLQRLIAHLFVCYINRPLLKIT